MSANVESPRIACHSNHARKLHSRKDEAIAALAAGTALQTESIPSFATSGGGLAAGSTVCCDHPAALLLLLEGRA